MPPDIADYFGFGKSKLPAHRSDVTNCPCMRCRCTRGIGDGLLAQSEAVKSIIFLRWLRWVVNRDRKDWPKVWKVDRRKTRER